MALVGEEGVGTERQLPPITYVEKKLISKQVLAHFSTLSLTQIFE